MKYETPELKIMEFDVENSIMTSGVIGEPGENDSPFLPNLPKTTGLDQSFDNQ